MALVGASVATRAGMTSIGPEGDPSSADDQPAILVVDDDEDSRRILMYGLGNAGYRVILAENGAAAVEMCRTLLPDLVIMDLAMPEMDGVTATQSLKANERTSRVPVIAWSARVFPGDPEELKAAGFDAVLAKPALPAEVVEAVGRYVRPGKPTRAD
jgi:two-component system cell cycle response regulator DivK